MGDEKITDTLMTDLVQKAVERGVDLLDSTEGIKKLLQALPSSAGEKILDKMDEYKTDGVNMFRDELRNFLQRVDLQQELYQLLSQMSIEINTEIRFTKVDGQKGGKIKPKVSSRAGISRKRKTLEADESTKKQTKAKRRRSSSEVE